ncbi:hypothetical protein, partial [Acinetobacter baumannii]
LTALGDNPKRTYEDSGYDYATRTRNGVVTSTATRRNVDDNGGRTAMLRYIGNLTDDLTLTALYGRSELKHENAFSNY